MNSRNFVSCWKNGGRLATRSASVWTANWTRFPRVSAWYETIAYLRQRAPEMPVILEAKLGDIGNTNSESDFADAAHRETEKLHHLINQYRQETPQ